MRPRPIESHFTLIFTKRGHRWNGCCVELGYLTRGKSKEACRRQLRNMLQLCFDYMIGIAIQRAMDSVMKELRWASSISSKKH